MADLIPKRPVPQKLLPLTPIKIRIALSRIYYLMPTYDEWLVKFREYRDSHNNSGDNNCELTLSVWDQLRSDVEAIFAYSNRTNGGRFITEDALKYWFPSASFSPTGSVTNHNYDYETMMHWINTEYDYIYTSHGLRLLINRYLRPNEPIQCCMLRIAKMFVYMRNVIDGTINIDYELWHIFYKMLACGFIQVSSILTDAEQADSSIRPGEACCLMVATNKYDRTFVKQMERVSTIASMGVGVGIGMSTVPLMGRQENGYVHSGFRSVVRKLDACAHLNIYERKPKIAIYLSVHCDTIFEALDVRHPAKMHSENCFIGLMISNYFMECVRNREDWYLFPADATVNGQNLCDFYGSEYVEKYKEMVRCRRYTKTLPAIKMMHCIVTALAETGGPYIVFEDFVNAYSNHKHLGKIKTLNLCSEITNYSTDTDVASCTLLSVNFALYSDFQHEQLFIQNYMRTKVCSNVGIYIDGFNAATMYKEEISYTFMLGFMGTWALNGLLGFERKRREIGINPMGVYDMALLTHSNPTDVCAITTEALYMGSIVSSCIYGQKYYINCCNYPHSPFSQGQTQFDLRNITPYADWSLVKELMMHGMANSMLTSQAPTATTSQLTGVTESVMLPMHIITINESENGRIRAIPYGIMSELMMHSSKNLILENSIDKQMAMYVRSAPFVDHSQSTIFSIEFTKQQIFNIIRDAYAACLKTAIYYVLPLRHNKTLQIIRNPSAETVIISPNHQHYPQQQQRPSILRTAAATPSISQQSTMSNSTENISSSSCSSLCTGCAL